MRWLYKIEWMDGRVEEVMSIRKSAVPAGSNQVIIYVNEHGHDRRFDEVVIPLENVRLYRVVEVA